MAIADQGGLGLPDQRLLLPRRCQVGGAAEAVRRAHRQDGGPPRRRPGSGRGRRPAGHEDRDRAREGRARRPSRAATRTRFITSSPPPNCRRSPRSSSGRSTSPASARRRSTRSTSPSRSFSRRSARSLASTPLDDLKSYLRWHWRTPRRRSCPTRFVDENFRFYGTLLTGAKELRPRWKRCVDYTDGDLGEALGQAFVKEAFGRRRRRHAEDGARARGGARARHPRLAG
jgi:endothelin-converting enzyme/putative endopeptidase